MKQFDVVIGNPPYQGENTELGQKQLYKHFVKKSIELSSKYISFVTPPTMFKAKISLIDGYKLIYFDVSVFKFFKNIGSSFCAWIAKKTDKDEITTIKTKDEEFYIDLKGDYFIPYDSRMCSLVSISIIRKIRYHKDGIKLNFKRNIIPLPMKAAFIRRQNRYFGYNCLITHNEFEKEHKLNQDYTITENAEIVQLFLNSKIMTFYYRTTATSPFILLGEINELVIPSMFDGSIKSLQNGYNLTQEEIDYIENIIK